MSVGSSVRVSASNRLTSSQYGGEGSVSWRYTRGDLTESAIPCRHHLRPSAYLRNDLTTDAYDCTVLLEHPSRSCFIISTSSTLLGEIVAKPSIRVLKLVKKSFNRNDLPWTVVSERPCSRAMYSRYPSRYSWNGTGGVRSCSKQPNIVNQVTAWWTNRPFANFEHVLLRRRTFSSSAHFNAPFSISSMEIVRTIHISEPTRRTPISYAVFCLTKKKTKQK